jgi:enoyl-CoA hydratase/carnithine racemase
MEYQKLHYAVADSVATITMDFPKNLNAIDEQMADELIAAIDQAEHDEAAKVIVVKSAGRAFSAGGDIGYFYKLIQAGGEINMDGLINKVGKVTNGLKASSKIVIAEVNGAAAGAGFPLALSADFVVAAENAKFIMAFINLGPVPDTGGTYLLAKEIGEKKAMELCATGRPVTAQEGKDLGFVYQVVPLEQLDEATNKLAQKFVHGPLVAYKNVKKQMYAAAFADYVHYLDDVENPTQHECSNTKDFVEGCKAFMEKRKAEFQGK